MDDVLLVGGFERVGNLLGDGQRFVDGNGAVIDAVREGLPSTSSITSAVVADVDRSKP